jgi:hypothetical protein
MQNQDRIGSHADARSSVSRRVDTIFSMSRHERGGLPSLRRWCLRPPGTPGRESRYSADYPGSPRTSLYVV